MSGHLTPNSFSSYFLTDDDTREGSILTTLQLQVIHNLMVHTAEHKLNLEIDPKNIEAYLQREASLAGEIVAYKTIIANSAFSTEEKENPAQN